MPLAARPCLRWEEAGGPPVPRSALSRTKGFTLVELLVVIGIIAVLMGILIPAVRTAKGASYRATCMSNLRQICTATVQYSIDNEGMLPWAHMQGQIGSYNGDQSNPDRPGWLYSGKLPVDQQDHPELITGSVLYKYVGQKAEVFHCPLQQYPTIYHGAQALTNFLMNASVYGNGTHFDVSKGLIVSFALTRMGANNVMFWEADQTFDNNGSPWNDGSSSPIDPPPPQSGKISQLSVLHGPREGGVGFFDAHVEWWNQSTFDSEVQNKPGRLWCNPESHDGTIPP